jgi:hypothetical protein
MKVATCQRSMTIEKAGILYNAMKGDKEAGKICTLEDAEGLYFEEPFAAFLEVNRDRLSLYEEPAQP